MATNWAFPVRESGDDAHVWAASNNSGVYEPAQGQASASNVSTNATEVTVQRTPFNGWTNYQGLLRFSTGTYGLPNGTIASILLRIWVSSKSATGSPLRLQAEWISPSIWPIDGTDYKANPTPNALATGVPFGDIPTSGMYEIPLIGLDQPTRAPSSYNALRVFWETPTTATIDTRLGISAIDQGANANLIFAIEPPPCTDTTIDWVRSGSGLVQSGETLGRFQNGTLAWFYYDTSGPAGCAIKKSGGVWEKKLDPTPGRTDGNSGLSMGQPPKPAAGEDIAWVLYQESSTYNVMLMRLSGNADGTITFGTPILVATKPYSTGMPVRLFVDNNGYVHCFYVKTTVGWTHRVFNPTSGTFGSEYTGVGSSNDPTGAQTLFRYDPVTHRAYMVYWYSRVDVKTANLTAAGVPSWGAQSSFTGTNYTGTQGDAVVDPKTGYLYIYKVRNNVDAEIIYNGTYFTDNGYVGPTTAPYLYWQGQPVHWISTKGERFVYGSAVLGGLGPWTTVDYVKYDGGAARWSSKTTLTTNYPWAMAEVLGPNSAQPDDFVAMTCRTIGVSPNFYYEANSVITNWYPPTYTNTPTTMRRFVGTHWLRGSSRFGGTAPF